jgi:ribonuclease T1
VRKLLALIAAILVVALVAWHGSRSPRQEFAPPGMASAPSATQTHHDSLPGFLPPEAVQTLALIAHGGPYPNAQDDSVFGNREGRLPAQPRGYYREYTVATPGASNRGTRRIIVGGQPPATYYYTDDHYETFRPFQVTP